ncbi:MAG: hypothetical protein J5379_09920 [Clostridiales bacterium]|nr:hypothetical protein [Clostridiales bacterium]
MKRLVCVFLAAVLLLGVTSCKKSTKVLSEVRTVPEDSPWWDSSITTISAEELSELLNDELYTSISSCLATDEESFVLRTGGFTMNLGRYDILRHYSYSGQLLGQVSISGYFGEDESYQAPSAVYKQNGRYYCFIEHFDAQAKSNVVTGYEVDFDAGTLKDPFPMERPEVKGAQMSLESVIGTGKNTVYLWRIADDMDFTYKILADDGTGMHEYVPSFGNGVKLEYIDNFTKNGNCVSFFADVVDNGQYKTLYCTLDPDSFTLQKEVDQYDLRYADIVPDCGIFEIAGGRKISRADIATGEKTELVNLDNTDILGSLDNVHVLRAEEERIVLFDSNQYEGIDSPKITVLTKAGHNPYAGRKILSLAYLCSIGEEEYAAISAFNKESTEYYLTLDHKYYDLQNSVEETEEQEDASSLADIANADAITVLMSDIRDGAGPDLVIYSNEAAQLNSADYLIDLSSRIDSEASLKDGDYMDFIHQPNGRDGKHYRLNYCFTSECFLIDKTYIDDGVKGLTYDGYDKLISEKHAGIGALFSDDLLLMKHLLMTSDCFSFNEEGKISLGSGDFRKASEYVASLPEGAINEPIIGLLADTVMFSGNMSFGLYFDCCEKYFDRYSIIGIPSSDGHAETIFGKGLGITSCSPSKDAAWSFVIKMMSPEIQKLFVFEDAVLKSALRASAEERVNLYNARPDPNGESDGPVSPDIVDRYIDQISDAVLVPDLDSSILVIVNEEVPAYFNGDKTLDEVIAIIENRVNLMLTERKAVE